MKFFQTKTNTKIFIIMALAVSLFGLVKISLAAPESVINYQGKLTNGSDVAVTDGDYDFILKIYDAASGGNCLWSARGSCETPTAKTVALSKGIFSTELGGTGDNALSLDFNSQYWLGVTVESDSEMLDRKKITAAGFALNSGLLDGLNSATSGTDAHIVATDSSGNLTVSANLSVGSTLNIGSSVSFVSSASNQLDLVSGDSLNIVSGNLMIGSTAVITSSRVLQNITQATIDNIQLDGSTISATGNDGLYLYDNASNGIFIEDGGFVGIGTTNPAQKLDIYQGNLQFSHGAAGADRDSIIFDEGGTANFTLQSLFLGTGDGNILNFRSDNKTSILALTRTSGYVGIGTTAPASSLNIKTSSGQAVLTIDAAGTGAFTQYTLAGTNKFETGWNNAASPYFDFYENGVGSRMVIQSGYVGIGTTSPVEKLHLAYSDTSQTQMYFTNSTTNHTSNDGFRLGLGASGTAIVWNNEDTALRFGVNNAEKMRIDATTFYLGIGTTSPGAHLVVGSGTLNYANGTGDAYIQNDLEVDGTIYGTISGTINPGFTTGSVIFQGASGLAQDNANFYWDDSSNELGIGTTAPGAALDVNGGIKVGSYTVLPSGGYTLSLGTSSNIATVASQGNYLAFKTNSTSEKIRITNDGYVGVGITGPLGLLHIYGARYTHGTLNAQQIVDDSTTIAQGIGGGIMLRGKINSAGDMGVFGGIQSFKANATEDDYSGQLHFMTRLHGSSSATRMVIDQNGNVGIGTTNPNAKLWLTTGNSGQSSASANADELVLEGSTHAGITVLTPNNVVGSLRFGDPEDNDAGILRYNHDGNDMSFWTAGGQQMTILSTGYVGVGTTTPSTLLHLGNTAYTFAASGLSFGDGDTGFYEYSDDNLYFRVGGSDSMNFYSGGIDSFTNGAFFLRRIGHSAATPAFAFNSDLTTGIFSPSDGMIGFSISGAEKVRIDSSGNVGVGTTSPSQKFDVSGLFVVDTINSVVGVGSTAPSTWAKFSVTGGDIKVDSGRGFYFYDTNAYVSGTSGTSGYLRLVVGSGSRYLRFDTADTERMRITQSGYVGVGTTLPGSKLSISGGIGVGTTSPSSLYLTTAAPDGGAIFEGNVGIGTTTPGQKLDVVGSSDLQFRVYSTGGGAAVFNLKSGGSDFYGGNYSGDYKINEDSNNRLTIKGTSGNVGLGNTSPGAHLVVGSGTLNYANGTGDAYIQNDLEVDGTIYGTISGTINPGFTTGSVIFQGASGLAQDNANFFWNDTDDRLGIGTTAPGAKLSFAAGTTAADGIDFGGDTNLYRYAANYLATDDTFFARSDVSVAGVLMVQDKIYGESGSPYPIKFASRGTGAEWMRITAGNVGIGTTAPGSGTNDIGFTTGGLEIARDGSPGLILYRSTAGTIGSARFEVQNLTSGRTLVISGKDGGSAARDIMSLDLLNGNVGIGTTAPLAKLSLYGSGTNTIRLSNDTTNYSNSGTIDFLEGNNTFGTNEYGFRLTYEGNENKFYIQSAAGGTASTALAILRDSGYVGIGTTVPGYRLTVVGSSDIRESDDGNTAIRLSSGADSGALILYDTGNIKTYIPGTANAATYFNNGGYVGIGTTSPSTYKLQIQGTSDNNVLGLYATDGDLIHKFTTNNNNAFYDMYQNGGSTVGIRFDAGGNSYLNGGYLGIGTTSPGTILDINGAQGIVHLVSTTGTNATYYRVRNTGGDVIIGEDSSGGSAIMNGSGLAYAGAIVHQGNYPLAFGTNNTARMVISNSGNVGIGTTSPGAHLVVGNGTLNYANGTGDAYIQNDLEVDGTIYGTISGTINPGFTQGSVIFQGASGLAQDNANFFWDDSSNELGIGTTAPSSLLTVNNGGTFTLAKGITLGDGDSGFYEDQDDSIRIALPTGEWRFRAAEIYGASNGIKIFDNAVSATVPHYTGPNDYNTGLGFAGADIVSLIAGGTNGLNVISSGNVGIGTTSPGAKLTISQSGSAATDGLRIYGFADSSKYLDIYNNGGSGGLDFIIETNGQIKYNDLLYLIAGSNYQDNTIAGFGNSNDYAMGYVSSDDSLRIVYGSSLTANVRMLINPTGYLGIGNTNPTAHLVIGNGTLNYANGTGDAYIQNDLEVDGTIYGTISGTINPGFTTGSVIFQGASGLAQDDANFFWDDSSNELGIGTTNPGNRLAVVGNLDVRETDDGNTAVQLGAGTSSGAVRVYSSGVVKTLLAGDTSDSYINNGGNVGIGTTLPGAKLDVNGAIKLSGTDNIILNSNYLSGDGGDEGVYVDSEGDVGIGTNNPGTDKLQVVGLTRTTTLAISSTGGEAIYANSDSSSYISMVLGGTNGFRLGTDSAQKIGFYGATPIVRPSSTTDLRQALINLGLYTTGGATPLNLNGGQFSTTGSAGIGTTAPGSKLTISGGLAVGTTSPSSLYLSTAAPDGGMIIEGNVGIGTTLPGYKLEVNGNIYASGNITCGGSCGTAYTAGSGLTLATTVFKLGGTISENTNLNLYSSADYDLRFYNSDAGDELLFLDGSTGYVGVGTTSPNRILEIASILPLVRFNRDSSSYLWDVGVDNGTYAGWSDLIFRDASIDNVAMMIESVSSNVGIGTTNPGAKLQVMGNGTGYVLIGDPTYSNFTGMSFNGSLAAGDYNIIGTPGDDNLYINRPTGGNIRFSENDGFPQLTIYTGGGVGVGYYNPGTAKLAVNGSVGIGTTDPATNLHIIPSANDFTEGLRFSELASGGYSSGINSASPGGDPADWGMNFYAPTAESSTIDVMSLRGNGYVGIGTTDPGAKLQVSSGDTNSIVSYFYQWSGAPLSGNVTKIYRLNGLNEISRTPDNAGLLIIDNAANVPLHIKAAYTDAPLFTVKGNGTVGIGTTAPDEKLTIYGDNTALKFTAASDSDYQVMLEANYSYANPLTLSGYQGYPVLKTLGGFDKLIFYTADNERMTIDNTDGFIGIGTTDPARLLHLARSDDGGFIKLESLSDDDWIIKTAGDDLIFEANDWAGDMVTFTSGGLVGIGTTDPASKLTISGGLAVGTTSPSSLYLTTAAPDGGAIFEGRVGIGTTAPGHKLEILTGDEDYGFVHTNGTVILTSYVDNARGGWLGTESNHNLNFFTNDGGASMTIDTSGEVGIGTTAPVDLLHVNGQGSFGDSITASNSTRGLNLASTDAVMRILRISADIDTESPGIELMHRTTADGSDTDRWDFFVNSSGFGIRDRSPSDAIRMTIDNDGYVGIGTTNPTNLLDITTGSTTTSGFHLGEADNEGGFFSSEIDSQLVITGGVERDAGSWRARATSASLINLSSGEIQFFTDSGLTDGNTYTISRRMTINSSGYVGIGTTAPSGNLHVVGTAYYSSSLATTSSTSGYNYLMVNTSTYEIRRYTSSLKYKDEVEDLPIDPMKVLSLRPVSFVDKFSRERGVGLIAEETAELIPDIVTYDAEGNPDAINYALLSVYNLGVLKQHDDSIKTIFSGTENLDSRLSAAEAELLINGSELAEMDLRLETAGSNIGNLQILTADIQNQIGLANNNISILQIGQETVGNNLNIASIKLANVENTVLRQSKDMQVEEIYSFAENTGEANSSLSDTNWNDGSFGGTYNGNGEFQEVAVNLNNAVDLNNLETGGGWLEYEIYISEADLVRDFTTEFGNEMDADELEWTKASHPYFLDGWNKVSLPVDEAEETGAVDWTAADYFRTYFKFAGVVEIRIKNVAFKAYEKPTVAGEDVFAVNLDDHNLTNEADQALAIKVLESQNSNLKIQTDNLNLKTEDLDDRLSALEINAGNLNDLATMLSNQAIDHEMRIATLENQVAGLLSGETIEVAMATESYFTLDEAGNLISERPIITPAIDANTVAAAEYKFKETTDGDEKNVGAAVIAAGEQEIFVANAKVMYNSKIIVTPVGSNPVNWVVSEKIDGEGFKIKLSAPAESDIAFDYWIILMEN